MDAAPRKRGLGRWLIDGPDTLAAAMLLALTLVTCVDVIGREVFRAPLKGADELTVVFMAISVYAVLGSITWREDHVCVDLIDLIWPQRMVAARQFVLNLVAAAFLGLVAERVWLVAGRYCNDEPWWKWLGDSVHWRELCAGGEVTMYLRFPKGPLTYFFSAMCAIAMLCLLANAVRYLFGRGPLNQVASETLIGKHRVD